VSLRIVEAMSTKENTQRTNARLGAVQALYQLEAAGQGVETVILEFETHRLGGEIEGAALHDADSVLFGTIVRGAVSTQQKIDPYIERNLADGWALKRINSTARAVLRAALVELVLEPTTPVRVILDEYVEIAKSFFDDADIKFINGLLDAAAHDIRNDEFHLLASEA